MYGGGWQYPVYASHYPPPGPVFLGPTAWAPAGAPANPHSPTGSPRQSPAGSPRVSPHTPVVPLAPEAYVNAPYPGQTYYHYPWSPNGSPWFTPTGFVPLPASPSLLAAYVPLPPSPSLSPVGAIPRPTYIPVPPIDPYYLPNSKSGRFISAPISFSLPCPTLAHLISLFFLPFDSWPCISQPRLCSTTSRPRSTRSRSTVSHPEFICT